MWHLCMYGWMDGNMYVQLCVCICACMHVCMYVCRYVCMYSMCVCRQEALVRLAEARTTLVIAHRLRCSHVSCSQLFFSLICSSSPFHANFLFSHTILCVSLVSMGLALCVL